MPVTDKPSKKQLENWMKQYVSSNNDLETHEKDEAILRLIDFFERHGITFDKHDPKRFSIFDVKAYPNYDQYMYVPQPHDIRKWLLAVKNINYKKKGGFSYKDAVRACTTGWKKMEIYDFLNWLKYYEEGAHMKYKFAQTWYANDSLPGYFLEIKKDKQDEQAVDLEAKQLADQRHEEKKAIIAQQRKKILSRLDSIRKLLRSQEGHMLAGDELPALLEAIHTLDTRISTVNKLSTSMRLYEDMIVREANVLYRKGFNKAGDMLYAAAQTPGASAVGAEGKPGGTQDTEPASPQLPAGGGFTGSSGGIINDTPGNISAQTPANNDANANQPPAAALLAQPETQSVGINQFIEAMNGDKGQSADDDNLEVNDAEDELLVSEAQILPPGTPAPAATMEDLPLTDKPAPVKRHPAQLPQKAFIPQPKPAAPELPSIEEPLEVTEDDITPAPAEKIEIEQDAPKSQMEEKIDAVMAEATLPDIVSELEDLAKIYKVREIARRFARIDDMLTANGLGSVFSTTLSEIQNKNFESGNYISTRLEDILSKLRGSLAAPETDLSGKDQKVSPEASDLKYKLEQDAKKETARKERKKQQEAAELEAPQKETPEIEMGELAEPIPKA